VGVLGSFSGGLGAGLVLVNRNGLSQLIGRLTGQDLFPAEIYHFTGLPVRYDFGVFLGVAFAGLALSVLAALVPAWAAARTEAAMNLRRT